MNDNQPTTTKHKMPYALASLKRWGVWKLDPQRGKIPYQVGGRALASSTDYATWSTYNQIGGDECANPAFFIDGAGLVFIDLDKLDKNWPDTTPIYTFLESLKGYQEWSQSNNGMHIVIKCEDAPNGHSCRFEKGLEVYSGKRFIAMTNNQISEADFSKVWKWQELVEEIKKHLLVDISKQVSAGNNNEHIDNSAAVVDVDDETIITRALKRDKFRKLHEEGNIQDYNDDRSSAVMAWLSVITYYTRDKLQVDRLFKQSALYARADFSDYRDCEESGRTGKWTRLHFSDRQWLKATAGKPVCDWSEENNFDPFDVVEQAMTTTTNTTSQDPYVAILHSVFGTPERDLMDGVARVKNPFQNLAKTPIVSTAVISTIQQKIDTIKREAKDKDAVKFLNRSQVEAALVSYQHNELEPRLLIQSAEWDGVDRIKTMSDCLKLRDPNLTPPVVEYFVKDWLVKCFRKIEQPKTQNRIIIFQGDQGAGKDEWLKTLCGGFGDYFITPSVANPARASEQFYAEQVYKACVALFDEFVRLDGQEAIIKSLSTKEAFTMRLPYERAAMTYPHRCSYVASCNAFRELTDTTGNRRYLVFELAAGKSIDWNYGRSDNDKVQILAQARAIYESKQWVEIPEYEKIMFDIQAEKTAEPAGEEIVCQFEELLEKEMVKYFEASDCYFFAESVDHIMKKLAEYFDTPVKEVRAIIKRECSRQRSLDDTGSYRPRLYSTRELHKDEERFRLFKEQYQLEKQQQ